MWMYMNVLCAWTRAGGDSGPWRGVLVAVCAALGERGRLSREASGAGSVSAAALATHQLPAGAVEGACRWWCAPCKGPLSQPAGFATVRAPIDQQRTQSSATPHFVSTQHSERPFTWRMLFVELLESRTTLCSPHDYGLRSQQRTHWPRLMVCYTPCPQADPLQKSCKGLPNTESTVNKSDCSPDASKMGDSTYPMGRKPCQ